LHLGFTNKLSQKKFREEQSCFFLDEKILNNKNFIMCSKINSYNHQIIYFGKIWIITVNGSCYDHNTKNVIWNKILDIQLYFDRSVIILQPFSSNIMALLNYENNIIEFTKILKEKNIVCSFKNERKFISHVWTNTSLKIPYSFFKDSVFEKIVFNEEKSGITNIKITKEELLNKIEQKNIISFCSKNKKIFHIFKILIGKTVDSRIDAIVKLFKIMQEFKIKN
jgi:hypothetical protein